jgi:uncharacterized protein YaaW (UPF0174 family)
MSTEHPAVEFVKHGVDSIAGAVAVGSLIELLPPIASAFTIIWLGLRIFITIEHRRKTGKWK